MTVELRSIHTGITTVADNCVLGGGEEATTGDVSVSVSVSMSICKPSNSLRGISLRYSRTVSSSSCCMARRMVKGIEGQKELQERTWMVEPGALEMSVKCGTQGCRVNVAVQPC